MKEPHFGREFQKYREAVRLSRRELAARLGVSEATVRNLEEVKTVKELRGLRPKTVRAVERFLEEVNFAHHPPSQNNDPRPRDHDEPRELHGRRVPVEAVVVGGYRGEAGELKDETYFLLNDQDPQRRSKVIRLLGDSMSPALLSGDLLVVDPKAPFTNGGIGVAQVSGESTVKKIYRLNGDKVRLEPVNPQFKAEELPASEVTIIGMVTDLVRKMV